MNPTPLLPIDQHSSPCSTLSEPEVLGTTSHYCLYVLQTQKAKVKNYPYKDKGTMTENLLQATITRSSQSRWINSIAADVLLNRMDYRFALAEFDKGLTGQTPTNDDKSTSPETRRRDDPSRTLPLNNLRWLDDTSGNPTVRPSYLHIALCSHSKRTTSQIGVHKIETVIRQWEKQQHWKNVLTKFFRELKLYQIFQPSLIRRCHSRSKLAA